MAGKRKEDWMLKYVLYEKQGTPILLRSLRTFFTTLPENRVAAASSMLPRGLLCTHGWLLQTSSWPLAHVRYTKRQIPLTFFLEVRMRAVHFGHLIRSSSRQDSKVINFRSEM